MKSSKWWLSSILVFVVVEVIPMDNEKPTKEQLIQQVENQLKDNQFYVYNEATGEGVVVNKNILLLSGTLKNMLEDIDSSILKATLPLPEDYSKSTLKFLFDVLQLYTANKSLTEIVKKISSLNIKGLINSANLANYLDIPKKVWHIFLEVLDRKQKIESKRFKELLPPQKTVALSQSESLPNISQTMGSLSQSEPLPDTSQITGSLSQSEPLPDTSQITGSLSQSEPLPKSKYLNKDIYSSMQFSSLSSLISDLKITIMKKYEKERKFFSPESDFAVQAVAFSPNGTQEALGISHEKNNLVLMSFNPEKIIICEGYSYGVFSLIMSSDGKKMISAGNNGDKETIIVWDISSQTECKQIAVLDCPHTEIYSLAISSDGKTVIAGCNGKKFMVWDISQGDSSRVYEVIVPLNEVRYLAFMPGNQSVVCLCVEDDESGAYKSGIYKVHIDRKEVIEMKRVSNSYVTCMTLSVDGKTILAGLDNGKIEIIDSNTHKLEQSFASELAAIEFITCSTDGNYCAVVFRDGLVIWDIVRKMFIMKTSGVPDPTVLVWSYDGKYLVEGGNGKMGLLEWSLLNDDELLALRQLEKADRDQVLFVDKLYRSWYEHKISVVIPTKSDNEFFKKLDPKIQELLKTLKIVVVPKSS